MKAKKIWFDKCRIHLKTDDGRMASLLLKDFPRLYNATPKQRENFTLSASGIHWSEIDEDLSLDGFFYEKQKPKSEVANIFTSLPEINVNQLARVMGINQSLLAKYICGVSTPSPERKRQIEQALHRLGDELRSVEL